MDIQDLARNLSFDEHGLLVSSQSRTLAYPEDGNTTCFGLEDRSFWFQHRNDCIISLVKRFPPYGPILDVGGGNGYVTRRLIDEGFDAALLEPGPLGALNGKNQREIPLVMCSTLEDAGFPEASLNAIGCFDVIEHIDDDQRFVDQIRYALRANGLLYATVPANRWLWSLSDVTARHYRRYTRKSIVALLADSFDLVHFTYFFRALTLPICLLRTLPHALGLSRKRSVLSSCAEHGTTGGISVRLLKKLLKKEYETIDRGRVKEWGTSCLFVARKKGS